MENLFTCTHCGEICNENQRCAVGEDDICESCANEETVICCRCGERIYRDDNAGDEHIPLCHDCFDRSYTTCECCGRVVHNDDTHYMSDDEDEGLCLSCYTRSSKERVIQDYCYKPEPIFYGDGSRYLGVELEIDRGGELSSNAREILNIANEENELAYCKHDGSLNDGFEIVTHPMTLSFHQKEMPWAAILEKAASMGYCSHKGHTCGLHVHVNRNCFGASEIEQDAVIARILYLMEKHWEELLKFSRRSQHQLERWAARYGYKEHPKDILDQAKKGYGGGRYSCVNLQNDSTIEFRVFRGTLKHNTVIATLQMVSRICDVAFSMSDEEIKSLSWTTFVSGIQAEEFPELVQYLKERRLYVNEAILMEAEI